MRKLRHREIKQLASVPQSITDGVWIQIQAAVYQPVLFASLLAICLSMVAPRGLINSGSIKRIITESRTTREMFHCTLCLSDYTWGISFRYFYNILRKTLTN